jgi:hypothetical protein
MVVCGLDIGDSTPFAQELRECSECIIERAAKVQDEMTGEYVHAGNEVCSAHGQRVAQMGVLQSKSRALDSAIQDAVDDLSF